MSKSFYKDLTGQKFGRLTVLEFVPNNKPHSYWKCKCECGQLKTIPTKDLKKVTSCGCLKKEQNKKSNITHGGFGTRLYECWISIKQRCQNPTSQAYKNYGGRGIKVCDEWLNDFTAFYNWAMNNGYSDELTIERIDVNGNYEPFNCMWTDMKAQARNRRNNIVLNYDGIDMTLIEIAEKLGLKYTTLHSRYTRGDRGERLFRPTYSK